MSTAQGNPDFGAQTGVLWTPGTGSEATFVPDVGANATYALGRTVAVTGRANGSLADGPNPFMGSLGLSIGLG